MARSEVPTDAVVLVAGSDTDPPSGRGLLRLTLDRGSGAVGGAGAAPADAGANPSAPRPELFGNISYLAWNPDRTVLYTAGSEGLGALRYSPDGRLQAVGRRRLDSETPCQIAVSADGRYLLSAVYTAGQVTVHALESDGAVGRQVWVEQLTGSGPEPARQGSAHAHQVLPLPGGRHLLVTDLGADRLLLFTLDSGTGRLTQVCAVAAAPGSGPRHAAIAGDDRVYVAGELDSSVGVYRYDAAAASLRLLSRCPSIGALSIAGDNYPSEIAASPDSRFVYVANRGTDVITVLAVDGDQLEIVADVPSGGSWAQHFVVLDSLLVVANQKSNRVTVFRRNGASGELTPTGITVDLPAPACVLAAPAFH
ncbi:lactonase family protein [Nakamurella lactea]|uniref:lactonase family protein n=1 Tax=Nakamurella lactea TaxID=459515 RepID=UPI0004124C4B|nr:lactonase family protein [Nakamurella lactea]